MLFVEIGKQSRCQLQLVEGDQMIGQYNLTRNQPAKANNANTFTPLLDPLHKSSRRSVLVLLSVAFIIEYVYTTASETYFTVRYFLNLIGIVHTSGFDIFRNL